MTTQSVASLLTDDAQEALYSVAYTFYRQGQYGEAVALFRTLTYAAPRTIKFWMALGACFQAMKDYTQAINSYEKAAMLNPSDPLTHLYAANCFFAKKLIKNGLLALDWAERGLKTQALEKRRNLKAHITLLRQAWKKEAAHG